LLAARLGWRGKRENLPQAWKEPELVEQTYTTRRRKEYGGLKAAQPRRLPSDWVNATRGPLYQHWSYSKYQAIEWRRFLASCGRN